MARFENRNSIILCVLALNCGILPQRMLYGASPGPRLAGIVCTPDQKLAILEVIPTHSVQPRSLILSEGEREGDVEVARIDSEGGTVGARIGGTNGLAPLRFESQTNRIGQTGVGFVLDHAGIDPVLRIYSRLTGKTLLRSPRVPAESFTLGCSATNRAEMVLVLEQALREKRISSIPDGDKFLMVVPEAEARTVQPRSSGPKSSTGSGDRPEVLPPGMITFIGADLSQAAAIYAALSRRKLEPLPQFRSATAPINLQTQTSLTREECLYALDTLFSWQGVKVIPVGQDSARLVPVSEAASGPNK